MPARKQTKKGAKCTSWTIHYGGLLDDDTEDSDFPSDWESDILGMSSNLESIISGNNEIINEACAKKAKNALEAKAHASKECEAHAAKGKGWEAPTAKEHAAEEWESPAAEEHASDNKGSVPGDDASEENGESCIFSLYVHTLH
jgi:hypothetical protein